jgi:hypothetical protein
MSPADAQQTSTFAFADRALPPIAPAVSSSRLLLRPRKFPAGETHRMIADRSPAAATAFQSAETFLSPSIETERRSDAVFSEMGDR